VQRAAQGERVGGRHDQQGGRDVAPLQTRGFTFRSRRIRIIPGT
jgi:hypothetical protein